MKLPGCAVRGSTERRMAGNPLPLLWQHDRVLDTGAILRQFDEAADEAVFVDLENGYYFPIDSRLHAFHDSERWALVVELVGYNPRSRAVLDVLHTLRQLLDLRQDRL